MADWKNDKNAFAQRFGLPYDDFVELITELPEGDRVRYDQILSIDQRAGVLWAIDQGKKLGLLTEKEAERSPATQGGFAAQARAALEQLDAQERRRKQIEET